MNFTRICITAQAAPINRSSVTAQQRTSEDRAATCLSISGTGLTVTSCWCSSARGGTTDSTATPERIAVACKRIAKGAETVTRKKG